ARGFDMRVLAYDVRRDEVTASGLATDYVPLDELLREADFVSIHASLTEQSRGMIGARELALMKPGAFLINAARGAIVDENAVVQALRENRIAGAALDVHWEEPLPRNHPLMTLDNCILTPHIGSHTIETARAVNAAAAQNLLDVLQGRRPRNVVNPEVYEAGSLR
ncbi:MAG: 2-hydroxyacid dehydrogenase, partial [Armatimonadota bacterium]